MSDEPRPQPPVPDRRWPRSVYGAGREPDVRFSLANERTFLAWIRTGLALLAAGVALEALEVPVHPGFRLAAAVVLLLLAVAAPAQAWWGWVRTERAVRCEEPLPAPVLGGPLAAGVLLAVLLLLAGTAAR
ncbi:putative membrane protein [Kineococcus xinjiangensis]|uniref:Putative membrane protein n=1 Tax=Kineococcus xinjiangensis TaxID=512762 RepID=A0A2S6IEK7_9ACTN|nr:DUF202 domain-containing protein [Kineococcus xinjiangensis]PPK92590.1 putative membrane protein [Kineococcus xinjiangensis]